MAAKSCGFDKAEVLRIHNNMEQELNTIGTCINDYSTYINDIENGTNSDGTKGLWSGKLAVAWVKAAKADCVRLNQIYEELNNCRKKLYEVYYNNKDR